MTFAFVDFERVCVPSCLGSLNRPPLEPCRDDNSGLERAFVPSCLVRFRFPPFSPLFPSS